MTCIWIQLLWCWTYVQCWHAWCTLKSFMVNFIYHVPLIASCVLAPYPVFVLLFLWWMIAAAQWSGMLEVSTKKCGVAWNLGLEHWGLGKRYNRLWLAKIREVWLQFESFFYSRIRYFLLYVYSKKFLPLMLNILIKRKEYFYIVKNFPCPFTWWKMVIIKLK